MFQVKVNDKFKFDIILDESGNSLNGKPLDFDLLAVREGQLHILKDNRSYNVSILSVDYAAHTFEIRVNNSTYRVAVKDRFDQLLQQMGMDDLAEAKINEIRAPMPGLVLDVMVKEGAEVKKDDSVLILEAMKMENVLKSPGEGKVKQVPVKKGEAVEKNQVLLVFE